MKKKIDIAVLFGRSLDHDEFDRTRDLLSSDCKYVIGDEVLTGPDAICSSYEQNMIAGRKKLDQLEWGKSSIEKINDAKFFVHFTDYLTHQGKSYTHQCKQLLTINDQLKITSIEHIHDQNEQDRLNTFYRKVGLM